MHTAARRIALPLMLACVCQLPGERAHAQELGFFTGLFKEIHSVTLYQESMALRSVSGLNNSGGCFVLKGLCGAGAEVLFDVSSRNDDAHVELGLGAGYIGSLRTEANSAFDLRGSLRSFPTAGAYLTLPAMGHVEPFVGVNFGIAELWNSQAYDAAGQEFGVKGQTFEYGLTGGLYRTSVFSSVGFFVEGGFRWRRFSSLDYTFPKGVESLPLPAGFSRKLDLSGWQLSIGMQFDLKPEKAPVGYPGSWLLTKLNDQPLPGLLSMQRVAGDSLLREEVVSAGLVLNEEQKRYTLELQIRRTLLLSDAKTTVRVEPLLTRRQRGVYRVTGDGTLCLAPEAPGGTEVCATRVGDDLLVRPLEEMTSIEGGSPVKTPITGNSFLFKKLGSP